MNFEGPKKIEENDLYSRIVKSAISILKGTMSESDIMLVKEITEDPAFRKNVKEGWDKTTIATTYDDKDPEEQEKQWAKGLAIRIEEELRKQNKQERAA